MPLPSPDVDKHLKDIEECASRGFTHEEIADYLGIAARTFRHWCKIYPQVLAAYKFGRAKTKHYVVGRLFNHIDEGNLSAIIFYLKTKAGFSEFNNKDEDRPADTAPRADTIDEESQSRIKELIRESEEEFREIDRQRASGGDVESGGD